MIFASIHTIDYKEIHAIKEELTIKKSNTFNLKQINYNDSVNKHIGTIPATNHHS